MGRGILCSALFASIALSACGRSTPDTTAERLDIRCSQDSDCPNGYECEVEEEHGTTTSFCKAHGGDGR